MLLVRFPLKSSFILMLHDHPPSAYRYFKIILTKNFRILELILSVKAKVWSNYFIIIRRISILYHINSRENFCLLNEMKCRHTKTCLP
ncbi:hypothetical protein T05_1165 [Trichinella murrelli]|uniref:Uncharacterized protein n=1 Tax=Trichinella murrelli TaxID=144512 RepID=A0A0V0U4T8_9BILA|nr:hypothetical protein T05_1165 [Trichinella murrelli]